MSTKIDEIKEQNSAALGAALGEEKKPYVPEKKAEVPLRAKQSILLGLATAGTIALIVWSHSLSKTSNHALPLESKQAKAQPTAQGSGAASTLPITDLNNSNAEPADNSLADPAMINRTQKQADVDAGPAEAKKLADVKQFDLDQNSSASYNSDAEAFDENGRTPVDGKSEREVLGQSSLVFVSNDNRSNSAQKPSQMSQTIDMGVGLEPGTRLRAHLISAVNTAVDTAVVAVVDYNYVHHGEIVVPAGSKVFGRLASADRSGYLSVRFDSMLLPSGETISLEATATDLKLRPLRGKTEGKNTIKRVLVASAAGIGEVAATVVGAGNLNQPLNQGDLVKSRVAENIGQASDNEVSRLAVTEHVVVSVPANTEIYVVLEKPANRNAVPGGNAGRKKSQSTQDLEQLLQLQKELNEDASGSGGSD